MVLKHSSSKDKFSFEQLENLITLCLPQFIFKLTSHLCDHLFIFLEILWQSTSQTKLWSSAPFKLYRGCEMHSLLLLHRCLLRRFETVEGVCKVHHWRQGQVFVQKKIDAHSYRIQISPVLVRTYQDSNTWQSLFFWSPLVRRHLFWPLSIVYISVIITHQLWRLDHIMKSPQIRWTWPHAHLR